MISTKVDTGEDRKKALNVAIGQIENAQVLFTLLSSALICSRNI